MTATTPSRITLRPYQLQAHRKARETWEHSPGALLVMATGTGKTITGLALAVRDFLDRGLRVVWLAHREELLNQPARNMAQLWPDYEAGIVQAERHAPDAAIVFASVDTLAASPHRAREIAEAGRIGLIVVDEAHHATTPTHRAAIEALSGGPLPPLRLGLTATPHRDDGADLSGDWEIAYSYAIAEAIRAGFLVRPYAAIDRIPDLNLEEIAGRWDYSDGELGAELLRAGVVAHTVQTLDATHKAEALPREDGSDVRALTARGRSVLVFTATIEQAQLTAEALCDAGWKARHLSGNTPKHTRRRLLRAFEAGTIDALCNAAVLTEGTDLPRASVVVLARPTRSWSLFVQMVGRGLRLHDGKEDALILDLSGATADHSLLFAPVLIGGSRCKKSPNGEHFFEELDDGSGKGQCAHCKAKIACFKGLGPHKWADTDRGPSCSACARPQCDSSPTRGHAWVPIADFKRRCLYCGAEVADPLGSMVGERRSRDADAIEADWVRLRGVRPHATACDVGEHGLLFVTFEDPAGPFQPIWLRKRARKPVPLSNAPVSKEYVRAYADDIVSRAAKVADEDASWKSAPRPVGGQQRYGERYGVFWKGESAGEYARRITLVRARERAIACGIVESV